MENTRIKKKKEAKITLPKWMDCTWRRVPCGRENCPICSQIKAEEERQQKAGESADDFGAALEDASYNIHEALAVIRADAAGKGFDIANLEKIKRPPAPHEFPLYLKLKPWRDDIFKLADEAMDNLEAWPMLDAGQDLLWYANMALAKTYRQLANRWQIEHSGSYGEVDKEYTGYVLNECLRILKESLDGLLAGDSGPRGKFNLALVYLTGLEEEIRKI
jgi:hypothetical protein